MGDRANIQVVEGRCTPSIFLYTHWSGSDLPIILRNALKRGKDRWEDPPYLTRIIFSEMSQKDVMGELGYGISMQICDGEDKILIVDCEQKTVCVRNKSGPKAWTFKGFSQVSDAECGKVWE